MGIRDTSKNAHTMKYFVFHQWKGHVDRGSFSGMPPCTTPHRYEKTKHNFVLQSVFLIISNILITYQESFIYSIYSDFSHFLFSEM